MAEGKEWHSTIDLGYLVTRYHDAAELVVDDAVDLVAKATDKDIPRRTGKTARTQTKGRNGLVGHVGYQSPKARALHENMTVRHRRGRAKFLESNLTGSADAIRRSAIAAFRAATQQGGR